MNTKQRLSTYLLVYKGISTEKLKQYQEDYELLKNKTDKTESESAWFIDFENFYNSLEYREAEKKFIIPNIKDIKEQISRGLRRPPPPPQEFTYLKIRDHQEFHIEIQNRQNPNR